MTMRSFQLTEALRMRAQTHGASGAAWIRGLDACVSGLERDWQIRVGESLEGGSESVVLNATRADGTHAILKVGLPGSADLAAEARVYRIAGGRGYAALLGFDEARNSLLLERLGQR